MKGYNPKIDIKFLTHLSDDFNHFESELRIKQIYKGHKHPRNFYEKEFVQFRLAVDYIKSVPEFDKNSVSQVIKMFDSCVSVNDDDLSNLIKCLKKHFDDDSLETKTEIFITSMKLLEHSDRQMSVSLLFANTISIRNGNPPLIFFNKHKFAIKQIVLNYGYDQIKVFGVFKTAYASMKKYFRKHDYVSLKEITNNLLLQKDNLINSFNISSLSIYGSYSRDEATEYSDLDLLVTLKNDELLESYPKLDLVEYLKDKIGLPIDITISQEIGKTKVVPKDIFETAIKVF